jgi:predicted nuclease of predicted toxin-antitoxin system
MKILLDENFPLPLVPKLRKEGYEVEHLVLLQLRGIPDNTIIDRLNREEVLFLTHDKEFLSRPLSRSPVIVSRVTQTLPNDVRVEIWLGAVREYFSREWQERLFEVYDDGRLWPWQDLPLKK